MKCTPELVRRVEAALAENRPDEVSGAAGRPQRHRPGLDPRADFRGRARHAHRHPQARPRSRGPDRTRRGGPRGRSRPARQQGDRRRRARARDRRRRHHPRGPVGGRAAARSWPSCRPTERADIEQRARLSGGHGRPPDAALAGQGRRQLDRGPGHRLLPRGDRPAGRRLRHLRRRRGRAACAARCRSAACCAPSGRCRSSTSSIPTFPRCRRRPTRPRWRTSSATRTWSRARSSTTTGGCSA